MNDAALTPRVGLSNTLRGGFFADGMQNVGPEPLSDSLGQNGLAATIVGFSTTAYFDLSGLQRSPSKPGVVYNSIFTARVPDEFEIPFASLHPLPSDAEVRSVSAETLRFVSCEYNAFATRYVAEAVDQIYVLENRDEVEKFIRQNRLRAWLLQAVEPLNEAFGEGAIKALRLETDEEGGQTLFCLVKFPNTLDEARHALAFFDRMWWSAHCAPVAGKLNFDFELV
jgi:hypothetical protein